VLGLVSTGAFYAAYAWIAVSAVRGQITLGQMTMYVMLFRQGQSAVSASLAAIGGMYEDNLYLSTLYEYLDTPVAAIERRDRARAGPGGRRALRARDFTYPARPSPRCRDVTFHLRPGQSLALVGENGSGKTTIIKLLTRLYVPAPGGSCSRAATSPSGQSRAAQRIGVIFQDFARYQLKVGENVGVGDVTHFEDEQRWREAADLSTATPFVETLPEVSRRSSASGSRTAASSPAASGRRSRFARAFMREGADILVLDEPTAAMDARAEAEVFEQFQELARSRMVILISHRSRRCAGRTRSS
jgi:ATP-binding cassette subfamily B protein